MIVGFRMYACTWCNLNIDCRHKCTPKFLSQRLTTIFNATKEELMYPQKVSEINGTNMKSSIVNIIYRTSTPENICHFNFQLCWPKWCLMQFPNLICTTCSGPVYHFQIYCWLSIGCVCDSCHICGKIYSLSQSSIFTQPKYMVWSANYSQLEQYTFLTVNAVGRKVTPCGSFLHGNTTQLSRTFHIDGWWKFQIAQEWL